MIRNRAEHIARLRDGRAVFIDGARVERCDHASGLSQCHPFHRVDV